MFLCWNPEPQQIGFSGVFLLKSCNGLERMAELKSIIQFFAVKITESVRRRAANGYGKNEIKYAGQSQHI